MPSGKVLSNLSLLPLSSGKPAGTPAGFLFGARCSIMTQYQILNMGYEQYLTGCEAAGMGYRPHVKDGLPAELNAYISRSTLIVKKNTKERKGTMKSALIVSLFTVLRLGIPLVAMLLIGETVRRHDQRIHKPGGA
jgi:hypothetical protein